MPFDVQGARAAGYTDKEIADHLAAESKFDLAGARKSGYSDSEIIGHLSGTAAPAPKAVSPHVPEMQALISQIPGQGTAPAPPQPAPPADPTLVQKLLGAGETALTLGTGATTGALGMLAGGIGGAVGNLTGGRYGIPGGVEAGMQQGAESLTYSPRTEAGQEQTQAVGNVLQQVLPAFPLTAELSAIGRGAGQAAQGARAAVAATAIPAAEQAISRIRAAAPAVAERVQRTLRRNPEQAAPTPGTLGSAGAAATDLATQRQQLAEQVGVQPTAGQLSREQQQLRFEQETAKGPQGAPIRERYSEQNEQIQKHFDNLVDQTGKETADIIGTGRSVDKALRDKVAQDKNRIRSAYKEADKAGEMESPVSLEDVVQHINENEAFTGTAPILNDARRAAIKTGIAVEGDNGQLIAQPVTLKLAEEFRKNIGAATDLSPPNIRQSAIIKGAIDAATEGAGGDLYRTARRLRENFAKQYEDRGVIASLLNTKKGMSDRKVALEDVFQHSILDASREQVGQVRRTLTAHPADVSPEVRASGQQAWKDLQGETASWIRDQAFSNTATDQRGNVIMSVPKLDRAIKKLDADGRLDTIFGKQGAQHMRDLNDLAKVIYTTPPGSVNTSNTAGVLMAALAEAGVTGSMTGLPVPILSGLNLIAKQVKDRKLRARIQRSLNPPSRTATP